MSDAASVGMVDSLADQPGGQTEEALEYARAYLADGDMPADLMARVLDPEARAERERIAAEKKVADWPSLSHYRNANAALAGQKTDVVFIGDSITEMWGVAQPDLFRNGVVNRGISGQTSPQILIRFMPDVVALKPRVVHLMCGVNDVAGNTGPTTPQDYQNNILAMLDLARAHGIVVILAGLTPVDGLPWSPLVQNPRGRVVEQDRWLAALAAERRLIRVDYAAALSDRSGAFRPGLTRDGVHPGAAGYALMRPLADAAVAEALARAA